MRNLFLFVSFIFFTILIISCNDQTRDHSEEGLSTFSVDSFRTVVKELSSDEYLGRKPFTEGETKTIHYIQKQFGDLGLEPGNGNNYFQDVPMVSIRATADSVMQVQSSKGNFTLKAFDDYVIWTDRTESSQSFNNE